MNNSTVMFIFCVFDRKYTFLEICSKNQSCLIHFKTKFGAYSRVLNRRPPSPIPHPLTTFSIFFHPEHSFSTPSTPLINYWGKFSTRVWNDILMLTFLQPCKRSDPSVVCFILQVRVKKPTQCFVYWMCCLILLMNLISFADHLQLKTFQLLCILF